MFLIDPLTIRDEGDLWDNPPPGLAILESSSVPGVCRQLDHFLTWAGYPSGYVIPEWTRDYHNGDGAWTAATPPDLFIFLGQVFKQVGKVEPEFYDVTRLPPGHPENGAFQLEQFSLYPGGGGNPGGAIGVFTVINRTENYWDVNQVLSSLGSPSYKTRATVVAENPSWSITSRQVMDAASKPIYSESWMPGVVPGMFRRNAEKALSQERAKYANIPGIGNKFWDLLESSSDGLSHWTNLILPRSALVQQGGYIYRKRAETLVSDEYPTANPEDWAVIGPANRWAMFSRSAQEQTRVRKPASGPAVIEVILQAHASDLIDALCLMNLEATSVRVKVQDAALATVYDRTVDLEVVGLVGADWYEFLTAPRFYQDKVLLTDIPGTTGARVTITITNTGGAAACGVCLVGKRVELGVSLKGAEIGFTDYSVKSTDEWGNVDVQERGFSDRATLPVEISNELLEPLKRTLLQFRARPALYVGHPDLPSTIVYGWFRDLSISVPYPNHSLYNLELESTT